jgi:uncharacterized membrane protein
MHTAELQQITYVQLLTMHDRRHCACLCLNTYFTMLCNYCLIGLHSIHAVCACMHAACSQSSCIIDCILIAFYSIIYYIATASVAHQASTQDSVDQVQNPVTLTACLVPTT